MVLYVVGNVPKIGRSGANGWRVRLHARNRWRLPVLFTGMLLASGRRTVTTWLRAAGVSDDYQDYYYFLTSIGCNSQRVATQLVVLTLRILPLPERVLVVIDDSPTKRYGPHVEGADVHHNPTPGRRIIDDRRRLEAPTKNHPSRRKLGRVGRLMYTILPPFWEIGRRPMQPLKDGLRPISQKVQSPNGLSKKSAGGRHAGTTFYEGRFL